MRGTVVGLLAILTGIGVGWWFACAPGDEDGSYPDARDGRSDDGAGDGETGSEATDAARCDANSQCDDGIACTDDFCAAGGNCSHTALDSLCPDGQVCHLLLGCSAVECTANVHCDDGLWCTGDEVCVSNRCFPGPARSCDDGDPCTEDDCNEAEDRCVRTWLDLEGCERDVPGEADATVPFDPAVHYSGRFRFMPAQSAMCGAATFDMAEVGFSLSAGALTVSGPPCNLRQDPAPPGADFDVRCSQAGCADYVLAGRFEHADLFTGHWTADFSGGCACPAQNAEVVGARLW
jgi:hypothetical protein